MNVNGDEKKHAENPISSDKNNLHIAGLILARGSSKGIEKKNVRLLAGYPLIVWSIRPMQDAKVFHSLWVSTDDKEIAQVAMQWGTSIHWRSPASSTDKASSLESVQEFLKAHIEVDVIGLVQCTSPCLHPNALKKAVHLIQDGCDSVFSVTRQHKLRWKEESNGQVSTALNFDPAKRPRRQDWKGEIIESGHFYFSKASLISRGYLQGGRSSVVELSPEVCIEIDREEDWPFAELAVKLYGYLAKPL